jgi:hypothetical protein
MLVLDTTSKTITAVLDAAPATQPSYVVAWADNNGTTFTEGANNGLLTGTSAVTITPAPAASTRRVIKSINIQNTNNAQVTVTISYVNSAGATSVIAKVTLNAGDTWTTDATFDPNGQLKYVFGLVNASTQLINQVPIANGGTGQSTQQAALTALSGAQTSGQYLRSNGTNTLLSAIQVADVPTLNQNTTGTAAGLSSTLAIASGGTGSTTLAGASITTYTGTEPLSNKTITPRVVSIADGTSIAINADTTDIATQANTQAVGTLSISAPAGTPFNGQKLILRISSTAVQTFSWDPIFTGSTDLSLPAASSGSSKYDYVGFIYNSTAFKWQLLAKIFGF